jgi:hypothetical protein
MKLRKHGVSLRIRRVGDRHMQTIKRDRADDGPALSRDEWECAVEGETPDLDAARGTALEPLLTRKTRRSLKPIFETVVRRTVHPITRDGTEIELSLDKGSVDDGRKSTAFCEAELELLRGDGAHMFRLARQLASRAPLQLGVRSKAERGYARYAPPGVVEYAVFGEDLIDGRAPTRGVVFTEDVMKIAGQQGRYAVGHGLSPLGRERGLLVMNFRAGSQPCSFFAVSAILRPW